MFFRLIEQFLEGKLDFGYYQEMQKITSLIILPLMPLLMVACTPSAANQDMGSGAVNSNISLGKPCYDMPALACETFYLTNLERQKEGLSELTFAHPCFLMAQEQSEDMSSHGYFDHQRPAASDRAAETFSDRAKRFGLSMGVGENIAKTRSAAQTVQMWMNSPGHRKNILNPTYKSFAVGYHDGLYTQVFWVNEEGP